MTLTVGVMPKSTRNPYFEDCQRGAEEAAKDLGFTLEWDGPPEPDADRQAQIVERWTRNGLPALAVSVESVARLTPALLDARSQGVRVLAWDADAVPEAREFTVVQATPDTVAHALSFEVGRITGGTGAFAAITSTLSAPNQSVWIAGFKTRLSREHPDLELVDVRPCDDVEENARRHTLELIETHPQIKAHRGLLLSCRSGRGQSPRRSRAKGRPPHGRVGALALPRPHRGRNRRQRRVLEDP